MSKAPQLSELAKNEGKYIAGLDLTSYYARYSEVFLGKCKLEDDPVIKRAYSNACIMYTFLLLEGFVKNIWLRLAAERSLLLMDILKDFNRLDFSERILNIGAHFKIDDFTKYKSRAPWAYIEEIEELRNIMAHPGWSAKYLYPAVISKDGRGDHQHELSNYHKTFHRLGLDLEIGAWDYEAARDTRKKVVTLMEHIIVAIYGKMDRTIYDSLMHTQTLNMISNIRGIEREDIRFSLTYIKKPKVFPGFPASPTLNTVYSIDLKHALDECCARFNYSDRNKALDEIRRYINKMLDEGVLFGRAEIPNGQFTLLHNGMQGIEYPLPNDNQPGQQNATRLSPS